MLKRLLLALCLLAPIPALADTAISLFASYAGNVSFTGIQKTMRTASNSVNACAISSSGTTLSATLSTLPAGATVLAAHLYWAGSGATGDYTVTFDGVSRSAPTARRYTSTTVGYNFFGGGVDVTSTVAAKGNGTYTFSGLTVDTSATFCDVEGVLGGFSLLVIYSLPTETFRVLNMYEGFRYVRDSSVTLSLSNFTVPNPLNGATGKVGHVTWEGDGSLGSNGETLTFNNIELYDATNPTQNQFNSSSSINGDTNSHGIDFDIYTVSSQLTPGMTSVNTVYASGQDLVLLHAEVIAVPNVPVADLQVTMTLQDSTVTMAQSNAYIISVKNNGPNNETDNLTITDTLPSNVTISSATGNGWTCNTVSQTVTCTRTGGALNGETLPPITIAFIPRSTVSLSNTATLTKSGTTMFDNVSSNNSATLANTVSTPGWVFTTSKCVDGYAFTSASQTCSIYNWGTRTAGTNVTTVYLTRLSGGVPTALHQGQNTTLTFYFGLACVNPTTNAGMRATFSAVTSPASTQLPLCSSNGVLTTSTSSGSVIFDSKNPSSRNAYTFNYPDVGIVEFYAYNNDNTYAGTAQSGQFVVKPSAIVLSVVERTSDGFDNPAPTASSGSRFVKAGQEFSMTIQSRNSAGAATLNFGRESSSTVYGTQSFSLLLGKGKDGSNADFANMDNLPALEGSFGAISGGTASGTNFTWSDVGILRLTPGIASGNYLGGGTVAGTAVNVGRFYPDRFVTDVNGEMTCSTIMSCPNGITEATYSGQPFTVTVTAEDDAGNTTMNYEGIWAQNVAVTARSAAGGGTQNPNGALNIDTPTTGFDNGSVKLQPGSKPYYALTNPYSYGAPRALNWTAPTTIYLRATESSGTDAVTSQTTATEGGIHVLNGRLAIPSYVGPETVVAPLNLNAQFWTGSKWLDNTADSISSFTPSGNLTFESCAGNLAAACSLTAVNPSTALTMANGSLWLRLQKPNATGRGMLRINGPSWLPTTRAQLVFGSRKPTVDYIREVY